MFYIAQTNQFIDRHEPWHLVKDPSQWAHLHLVLATALESVRLCSCLLRPVIPDSTELVLKRLGLSKKEGREFPSLSDLDCQLGQIDTMYQMQRNVHVGGKPLFTKIDLNCVT